jgi:hypothetical protein
MMLIHKAIARERICNVLVLLAFFAALMRNTDPLSPPSSRRQ